MSIAAITQSERNSFSISFLSVKPATTIGTVAMMTIQPSRASSDCQNVPASCSPIQAFAIRSTSAQK